MFDNLLYIFSKDTNDDVSIDNNYYVREVNKLNKMLLQKNSELHFLQRKYNKLLNHCIENELTAKLNDKKRIESIIIKDIRDSRDSRDSCDSCDSHDSRVVLNTTEPEDSDNSNRKPQYFGEDAIYIRENNRYFRDASDNDEYEKI
jgi:hypothetical protein